MFHLILKITVIIFIIEKKGAKKNDIIKFKSKSIDRKLDNEIDDEIYENYRDPNKDNLIDKFKVQFENIKIKNLDRPDKLEYFINDKFIREKSGMAKKVEDLNRQISN